MSPRPALVPEPGRDSAAYEEVATVSIRTATDAGYPALLEIRRRSIEVTHEFVAPVDVDALEQEGATYLPLISDLSVAWLGPNLLTGRAA